MQKTELLKLDIDISDRWNVPISSGFYHESLVVWFNYVGGLKGEGLAIGDNPVVVGYIKERFPESITRCVDFNCPEGISWDICKPPDNDLIRKYNWIICQAVLEHVLDPTASIRNLVSCLSDGGTLFIHVPPPGFPVHRYPIDCLRFLPDFFIELPKIIDANIIDLYIDSENICSLFRKRNGS